ncbi:MAG: hypothetical protein NTY07_13570 [Bacteroidia bacterium]|nr:hypothetical protein [Bacteroidia bacterium]
MKLDSNRGVFSNCFRYFGYGFIVVFALIGLFLTTAFFAVKLHVTDDPGAVDYNDRYFQELKDKYGQSDTNDSSIVNNKEATFFHNVLVLNKYYPENSLFILNAYLKSHNLPEAERMVGAVNLYMQDNKGYNAEIKEFDVKNSKVGSQRNSGSVFEWMNIAEWEDFKLAVAKDKPLIDSVSNLTDVEPRLIVAVLVGEQIRLFNSDREAYKKWIGPLKILSVESTFSLGVTGIKIQTAQMIERNLKDRESVFYLGEKYEHLLEFQTNNMEDERFKRLTSYKNHFYSYLYAALNIKQIKMQWERAGFPIADRPEILATLYNIGFEVSLPKANPIVGGSTMMIHRKPYSFGTIAYEYYYSGELFDLFPFKRSKFDWNHV